MDACAATVLLLLNTAARHGCCCGPMRCHPLIIRGGAGEVAAGELNLGGGSVEAAKQRGGEAAAAGGGRRGVGEQNGNEDDDGKAESTTVPAGARWAGALEEMSLLMSRFEDLQQTVRQRKEELGPFALREMGYVEEGEDQQHTKGFKQKQCIRPGCTKSSVYGSKDEGVAIHCGKHRAGGDCDVLNAKCAWTEGCETIASFGDRGGARRPVFCGVHRTAGHENLRETRCVRGGCKRAPTHRDNKGKSRACLLHSGRSWIPIAGRVCQAPGCTSTPTYGYRKGSSKDDAGVRTRCPRHKEEGQEDLKYSKVCQYEGCKARAWWVADGAKVPTFCTRHAPRGSTCAKPFKTCSTGGCCERGVYGSEAGSNILSCKKHRTVGQYDVTRPLCRFAECRKQPSYVRPGGKKSEYCKVHAPRGYQTASAVRRKTKSKSNQE